MAPSSVPDSARRFSSNIGNTPKGASVRSSLSTLRPLALLLVSSSTPAFAEAGLDPAGLYSLAAPSVVVVLAQTAHGVSQGSGVVVGDRQIVTNDHVVRGATSPFILIRQGDSAWRAELENTDPAHDLAILGVVLRRNEKFQLPPVKLRRANTLRVGERVYAIGSPRGLERTLSEGLISGIPVVETTTIIQTTASISPGSSGGGLFDAKGNLVGITTLYLKDSQNLNFAVSPDDVETLQKLPDRPISYSLAPSPPTTTPAGVTAAASTGGAPSAELPTALKTVQAVVLYTESKGPVATAGGMTDKWIHGRVAARLRKHGIWVFDSPAGARKAEKFALPLFVEVHSMNITDTVFYPWKLDITLMDTADFTDGSKNLITLWNFNTYGYGGSDVVLDQLTETIDTSLDDLAAKLAKP